MPARARRHWLFKSDPGSFGWEDLLACPGRTTFWDGVRNYQARNLLRDEVRAGDGVLFYHSSSDPPAVVGLAEVVGEARTDPTQFERGHEHEDPGSDPAAPRWLGVDVRATCSLPRPLPLAALKAEPALSRMLVVQRGQRLSIQPLTPEEWALVLRLGGVEAEMPSPEERPRGRR
jgi:predicted RNA-binding protein with PUA-like domain